LSLRDAMLMNGVLAHGIDYDDTYLLAACTTASCFPCTGGRAERQSPVVSCSLHTCWV
jgi:hypothetical protein